jgi:polyisoprenoid-binding protein YceI
MRRNVVLLGLSLCLSLLTIAATGVPGVGGGIRQYTVNNQVGPNSLEFISEAPLENIRGTADGITGSFKLDASNLESSSGTITVQVRSMKTAITKRDGHMYSATWLDADKFPTISYALTGLKNISVTNENGRHTVKATAAGTFTCHGVSKPLTANVVLTLIPESDETRKRATGNLVMVAATFEVPLAEFGIKGKEGLVGSSVGEVIKISAKLYSNG